VHDDDGRDEGLAEDEDEEIEAGDADAVGPFETRAERLAYLAGLAEGVEARVDDPPTASLLTGIVEILGEISEDVTSLRRHQRSLAEDMEELAEEIGVQPSDVVVECPSCGREVAFAADLMEEEDLELTCPNCGEVVYTPGEDQLVDRPGALGEADAGPRSAAAEADRRAAGLEPPSGPRWDPPRG